MPGLGTMNFHVFLRFFGGRNWYYLIGSGAISIWKHCLYKKTYGRHVSQLMFLVGKSGQKIPWFLRFFNVFIWVYCTATRNTPLHVRFQVLWFLYGCEFWWFGQIFCEGNHTVMSLNKSILNKVWYYQTLRKNQKNFRISNYVYKERLIQKTFCHLMQNPNILYWLDNCYSLFQYTVNHHQFLLENRID